MKVVLGVDLAGSTRRPTGLCTLKKDGRCATKVVYRDDQVVETATQYRPLVIAVDAPLSLPKGRQTLDKPEPVHFRQSAIELRRRGIRVFPMTIGPMRGLAKRGIALRKNLAELGFAVIEVFPGGAQDVLGLPRKQHGVHRLIYGLRRLGLSGLTNTITDDEADAATCALVGLLYLRGEYEALGDPEEGQIVMPKLRGARSSTKV